LVVTRLPYCADWFENGENENGLVVPVRDPTALSEAVVALCADAERRQRLGAAGRRLVEARADYRRCMDELEVVYRELLASTTRRKDS
jgi:glycosyltransferase involved in cell wall biosynthesis